MNIFLNNSSARSSSSPFGLLKGAICRSHYAFTHWCDVYRKGITRVYIRRRLTILLLNCALGNKSGLHLNYRYDETQWSCPYRYVEVYTYKRRMMVAVKFHVCICSRYMVMDTFCVRANWEKSDNIVTGRPLSALLHRILGSTLHCVQWIILAAHDIHIRALTHLSKEPCNVWHWHKEEGSNSGNTHVNLL